MPRAMTTLVGTPFPHTPTFRPRPVVTRALDLTEDVRMRISGRALLLYAERDNGSRIAVVLTCSDTTARDGLYIVHELDGGRNGPSPSTSRLATFAKLFRIETAALSAMIMEHAPPRRCARRPVNGTRTVAAPQRQ